jgi:hypothetical protein
MGGLLSFLAGQLAAGMRAVRYRSSPPAGNGQCLSAAPGNLGWESKAMSDASKWGGAHGLQGVAGTDNPVHAISVCQSKMPFYLGFY